MRCNLDSMVPLHGQVAMHDFSHYSFQEIMDLFDFPICSWISRTGLDVLECQGFGQVLPMVINKASTVIGQEFLCSTKR